MVGAKEGQSVVAHARYQERTGISGHGTAVKLIHRAGDTATGVGGGECDCDGVGVAGLPRCLGWDRVIAYGAVSVIRGDAGVIPSPHVQPMPTLEVWKTVGAVVLVSPLRPVVKGVAVAGSGFARRVAAAGVCVPGFAETRHAGRRLGISSGVQDGPAYNLVGVIPLIQCRSGEVNGRRPEVARHVEID